MRTHQEDYGDETAKIAALRQAAERGWSDLAAGRFADVDDSSLGDFIAKLGAQPPDRDTDATEATAINGCRGASTDRT